MTKDEDMLDSLQRAAFDYFLLRANPLNGLVPDTSREGAPASVAAVGFALSSYPVAVERGWITRAEAVRRTLAALRFFTQGPPGATFRAIGHRGFCYHFLDMKTGRRAWDCEVSFIDTALLLAGMFTAAAYFSGGSAEERDVRALADRFYRRIEWDWALNKGETLAMAWTPGKGFETDRWTGYNEGLILYLFGLASPTYPLDPRDYKVWLSSYEWREAYGLAYLYAGPFFIHHFSHAWVDFRGIRDDFMRLRDCDYFENSRRAALVQRRYAMENEKGFAGYGADCWGLSACDGPSNLVIRAKGKRYRGRGYAARGAPDGPDDGTLTPSALVASLPFTPELTLRALRHIRASYPDVVKNHHVPGAFNPTAKGKDGGIWISDGYYGLDQGIMLMMIENHRSRFFWKLLRKSPYLRKGLAMAGFRGGWLARRKGAAAP